MSSSTYLTRAGLSQRWDKGDREETTAFHRSIASKVYARHEILLRKASMLLLVYDQGYSLTDVGAMFGVTRERVRQIIGGTPDGRRPGAVFRMWDDDLNRFVACSHGEMAAQAKKVCGVGDYARQRTEALACSMAEDVDLLGRLYGRLGRQPTLTEMFEYDQRAGGYSGENPWRSALYGRWGAGRSSTHPCSPTEALNRLWCAAGFTVRKRGHLSPIDLTGAVTEAME